MLLHRAVPGGIADGGTQNLFKGLFPRNGYVGSQLSMLYCSLRLSCCSCLCFVLQSILPFFFTTAFTLPTVVPCLTSPPCCPALESNKTEWYCCLSSDATLERH